MPRVRISNWSVIDRRKASALGRPRAGACRNRLADGCPHCPRPVHRYGQHLPWRCRRRGAHSDVDLCFRCGHSHGRKCGAVHLDPDRQRGPVPLRSHGLLPGRSSLLGGGLPWELKALSACGGGRVCRINLGRSAQAAARPDSNRCGVQSVLAAPISFLHLVVMRPQRLVDLTCRSHAQALDPARKGTAEIGRVAVIGADQPDLEDRVWRPIPLVRSIGSPAVFHSGNPSSSRRAR